MKKVVTENYTLGCSKNPELSADMVWCAIKGVIEKRQQEE